MHQKHQGHGICGSRNIYSSKVHIDNWVEDKISLDLLSKDRIMERNYTTLTKDVHCHPCQWPELPPAPAKMATVHELKTKNKEGLAYDLLFEHGGKHETFAPNDRFRSVTSLTIMSRPGLPEESANSKNELLRKKSRQMLDDLNQSAHMTTEARYANAHLKFNADANQPTLALLKTAEIPKFHRRRLLT
jgi:hypothetical protein